MERGAMGRGVRQKIAAVLAVALSTVALATGARAAELMVFERKGCVYCLRFDAEVAPIYPKTEEGRRAPLRRIDLADGAPPDVALAAPVRFTPTFILVEEGREIGRMTGYVSDDTFWGLLSGMTAKLRDANLGDANLGDANLGDANLGDANLGDAR